MRKNFKNLAIFTCLLCFIMNSCDKAEDEVFVTENSNLEFIDIANFENPETMWLEENKNLYNAAYSRFMSKVYLVNGLYQYDMISGEELRISDEIFEYIKENIDFLNSRVESGTAVIFEDNDELLFTPIDTKKRINRLTASIEDFFQNIIPMHVATGPQIVNRIASAMSNYNSGQGGNVSDYFSWHVHSYNQTGTANFAGHNVTYHISSSVGPYQVGNVNNNFVQFTHYNSGGYTYFNLRNSQGNTLMSIRAQGPSAAYSVWYALTH